MYWQSIGGHFSHNSLAQSGQRQVRSNGKWKLIELSNTNLLHRTACSNLPHRMKGVPISGLSCSHLFNRKSHSLSRRQLRHFSFRYLLRSFLVRQVRAEAHPPHNLLIASAKPSIPPSSKNSSSSPLTTSMSSLTSSVHLLTYTVFIPTAFAPLLS